MLTFAALAVFTIVLTIVLDASGAGRIERVGDIPLLVTPNRSGFSVPVIALSSTMKSSSRSRSRSSPANRWPGRPGGAASAMRSLVRFREAATCSRSSSSR
jgi:hypothetical protein